MITRMLTGCVAALVLTAVACGGGGDSGDPVGGSNGLTADFTPTAASPAADSVTLQKGTVNGNTISLRVAMTDVAGVYGAAFDVTYDGTKAQYVGWSAGTVLESGGHAPTYQVSSSQSGRVVVGASRTGSVPAVNVTGTATLVNLTFRVLQGSADAVDFSQGAVYGAQNPPVAISGIGWAGGTLTGL